MGYISFKKTWDGNHGCGQFNSRNLNNCKFFSFSIKGMTPTPQTDFSKRGGDPIEHFWKHRWKSDLDSGGVWRSMFTDYPKNGGGRKLLTSILIQKELSAKTKRLNFFIFGTSGNVEGPHKPIMLDFGSTKITQKNLRKETVPFSNNIVFWNLKILKSKSSKNKRVGKSLRSV